MRSWLREDLTAIRLGASKPSQLEDNLKATEVTLDSDDLARLDAATLPSPPYPHWFTPRVADAKAHAALGIKLATPPVR